MRKIKLSHQIAIIFLLSFIITSVLLDVFIIRRLDDVYEDSIFKRLESFGKSLRQKVDISSLEYNEDISYIIYNSFDSIYQSSDNIEDYISEYTAKLLINKVAIQEDHIIHYKNIADDHLIYYVVLNYQGFFGIQNDDIFIVMTDDTMKNQMVKNTTLQIIFACFIAFMIGYLIIILWVARLINDTKKISNELQIIGDNHYKTKIFTRRKDEIGDLVSSIELMRKMIIENEKNNQEIIQGVSHDLKTPIAIISSFAEALEDGICDKNEAVNAIERQCVRLNAKITQLLNLTRLEYIDINNKTVTNADIGEIIQELSNIYSLQTEAQIEMNISYAEFFGDRESWLIVIQNILDNAIRYAKSKIIINLNKDELTIFNDGKQVDTEKLSSIFDAYEKSDDGKFGLGLSIVKKTVELFGYDITAKNLDNGVLFKITHKGSVE